MRILYGVVGEGMGHAIRSKVIIDHLIKEEGHEVEVVVSGRAFEVLEKLFPEVHKIWGLTMTYKDNEFKAIQSVLTNAKKSLSGIPENIRQYVEVTRNFDPECVISDFDSWSYLYAQGHHLPVICVDNIQMMARCRHPKEFIKANEPDFTVFKNFVKGKLPGCLHYYITTFFYPEVSKDRTTLVPPVLRKNVLNAQRSKGEHILVYLTSDSAESLIETLKQLDREFKVYGHRRDLSEPAVDGNLTFCPFDETTFVQDLSSCAAVFANGGFTLLGEAVYLNKPVLSIPIKAQLEQVLNAYYIEQLGYGYTSDELDVQTARFFLENLPKYEESVSKYEQEDGNQKLFTLLDEQLDRIAGGLK